MSLLHAVTALKNNGNTITIVDFYIKILETG